MFDFHHIHFELLASVKVNTDLPNVTLTTRIGEYPELLRHRPRIKELSI